MRSGTGTLPDLGTQISMSRPHATVLMSFRRYQSFLLVKPPPDPFSDLFGEVDPRGSAPSSLVSNSSMKDVVLVDSGSDSILTRFTLSRFCSPDNPVLLSAYDRLCNHLFLLCHVVPHHHHRSFIITPEDRSRRFLTVSGWWGPLVFPVNFLPWFPLL